jgi:hypothetical protein
MHVTPTLHSEQSFPLGVVLMTKYIKYLDDVEEHNKALFYNH